VDEGAGPSQIRDREVRVFPQQKCLSKSNVHSVTVTALKKIGKLHIEADLCTKDLCFRLKIQEPVRFSGPCGWEWNKVLSEDSSRLFPYLLSECTPGVMICKMQVSK